MNEDSNKWFRMSLRYLANCEVEQLMDVDYANEFNFIIKENGKQIQQTYSDSKPIRVSGVLPKVG